MRPPNLQTILGEHNDAVVAGAWLRTWAAGRRSGDAAFAAGMLAGIERSAARDARERWRKAWKRSGRGAGGDVTKTSAKPKVVRAAGGLVWRMGSDGKEIVVVHRPAYDDWSFPKGKLDDGESELQAALREVEEEVSVRGVARSRPRHRSRTSMGRAAPRSFGTGR